MRFGGSEKVREQKPWVDTGWWGLCGWAEVKNWEISRMVLGGRLFRFRKAWIEGLFGGIMRFVFEGVGCILLGGLMVVMMGG